LAALGGALPLAAAAQLPTLRFALGQSWASPFLERAGTRVLGGILPDLMTGIAAEAGMTPHFELLPPARVEAALADGSVDMQCLLAPSWWPHPPEYLHWSVPVLVLRDVLVTAAEGPATAEAFDRGRRWSLGVVRGYRYPTLEGRIQAGELVRDDALDQWAVLEKLARGRTAVGVVNELTLRAYNQRSGNPPLRVLKVVDEVGTHCLITDHSRHSVPRLQEAIRRWVAKGGVKRVLAAYQ
jgi:ABC-type amino acid transport substrate-binding protein